MTQNKTINEQIEEIKKGCGNKTEYLHGYEELINWRCGEGEPTYKEPFLCFICQAKLSTLQEAQKIFLEDLKKDLDLFERLNERIIEEKLPLPQLRLGDRIEELKELLQKADEMFKEEEKQDDTK